MEYDCHLHIIQRYFYQETTNITKRLDIARRVDTGRRNDTRSLEDSVENISSLKDSLLTRSLDLQAFEKNLSLAPYLARHFIGVFSAIALGIMLNISVMIATSTLFTASVALFFLTLLFGILDFAINFIYINEVEKVLRREVAARFGT